MTAKSLFGSDPTDDWSQSPKTKKGRLPGPSHVQKEFDGKVGQGPQMGKPQANTNEVLEPALKLGAKAGESWTFLQKNVKHVYTLERFDNWRGRPSAIITEVIVSPLPGEYQRDIRHVYARGLGEVERQEWVRLNSIDKKLLAEKKIILLEDLPLRGPKPEEKPKGPAKDKEAKGKK